MILRISEIKKSLKPQILKMLASAYFVKHGILDFTIWFENCRSYLKLSRSV